MNAGEYCPWSLEDPSSTREIKSFETFRYYALSPETTEVTFYLDRSVQTLPEMEAHGPENRKVWIELPMTLDPEFWVGLNKLAHQLARREILKPG